MTSLILAHATISMHFKPDHDGSCHLNILSLKTFDRSLHRNGVKLSVLHARMCPLTWWEKVIFLLKKKNQSLCYLSRKTLAVEVLFIANSFQQYLPKLHKVLGQRQQCSYCLTGYVLSDTVYSGHMRFLLCFDQSRIFLSQS